MLLHINFYLYFSFAGISYSGHSWGREKWSWWALAGPLGQFLYPVELSKLSKTRETPRLPPGVCRRAGSWGRQVELLPTQVHHVEVPDFFTGKRASLSTWDQSVWSLSPFPCWAGQSCQPYQNFSVDRVFPTGRGSRCWGKCLELVTGWEQGCSSPHTTFIKNWKLLHCNEINTKSFSDLITLLLLCRYIQSPAIRHMHDINLSRNWLLTCGQFVWGIVFFEPQIPAPLGLTSAAGNI